ncbi:MAG: HesA/MoeB/ThiF family protein [Cytophagales bacterium]|nr:MAG: HesA/MoeB/ThiF family protein [Cytophagales bacterium]
MNRFERQIALQNIGVAGQAKIRAARVLVVGIGGLGNAVLPYLAAAGVGTIGLVDGDTIALNNLNRQILFSELHIGQKKAEVALALLKKQYTDIIWQSYPVFLTPDNIVDILPHYDLVIDATDNFATRYLINDACFLWKKPWILGAIYRYEGQYAIFNVPQQKGSYTCNYRDVYPQMPAPHEVPNCHETGVIGALVGIIGTMQAAEAIKYIAQIGNSQGNQLYYYHFLENRWHSVGLSAHPKASQYLPKNIEELKQQPYASLLCTMNSNRIISWQKALAHYLALPKTTAWIDLRAAQEMPQWTQTPYLRMAISDIESQLDMLQPYETLLLFCQTGIRSNKALGMLQQHFPDKEIFTLQGGIQNCILL